MGSSAISSSPSGSAPDRTTESDVAVKVLSKALKTQKENGEALVRLVEQHTGAGDKGQNVDYYA
jgi:hypothetical protein